MKMVQAAIWVTIFFVGTVGIALLFGFFLTFLAGIIGAGFIVLAVGAIISIVERLSEKLKGR